MIRTARSAVPTFAVAGLSVLLAVVAGVARLGHPLHLVQLLTIIGLSMTAGDAWAQAISRARDARRGGAEDANGR